MVEINEISYINRIKSVFHCFSALVLAFCVQIPILIIFGKWLGDVYVSFISASFCILGFGLWFYLYYRKDEEFTIKKVFAKKDIVLLLLWGIALHFLAFSALNLLLVFQPQWFVAYLKLMKGLDVVQSPFLILYVGLVAPISEEILFRGIILREGEKGLSNRQANVLQAFLFGVYHFNLVQGLYAFVLGLFLGKVTKRYQSIIAAILVHMVFNLTSTMVAFTGMESFSVWQLSLFLFAATVTLMGLHLIPQGIHNVNIE